MGRPKRAADGGLIYHVLNRANARMPIFEKDGDYEAFEVVLQEAVERTETRLLAYCLLANHWHLIVWPREDGVTDPDDGPEPISVLLTEPLNPAAWNVSLTTNPVTGNQQVEWIPDASMVWERL